MPESCFLLIGGWPAIVAKLAALDVDLVLFHKDARPLPADLAARCRAIVQVDTEDPQACLERARALHDQHGFCAVYAIRELDLVSASVVGEALGIVCNPVRAVHLTRDKVSMREALAGTLLDTVPWGVAASAAEARALLDRLGSPVIVKPRTGVGSQDIHLVASADELERLWPAVLERRRDGVIMERFIGGTEYSVEAVTLAGQHTIIGVTQKFASGAPHFFETGHVFPLRLSDALMQQIQTRITTLLDVVGMRYGMSHTEIKIHDEVVHIIETHTRPGGDRIWHLIELARGTDAISDTFRSMLGQEVAQPVPVRNEVAAVGYFHGQGGLVRSIDGVDAARAMPGVVDVEITVKPGQQAPRTHSSNTRYGFVIAQGPDGDSAQQRLAEAMASIRIELVAPGRHRENQRMSTRHIVFLESNLTNGLDALRHVKQSLGYRITFITCDLDFYLAGRPIEETALRFADRILRVDSTRSWSVLREPVEKLMAEEPIDAFLTFNDIHIIACAEVAEALGLPHISARAARAARTKHECRGILAAAGVPQPRYRMVTALDEALSFAAENGYPFITKPTDGSASVHARLVTSEAELRDYFAMMAQFKTYGRSITPLGQILLEEYVHGDLVSVETLTRNGKHEVLGMTDRRLGGYPYFVELGGSFPAPVPGGEQAIETALRALDAIGVTFGPAHTEVILSPDGPRLVEINPRLVGGVVTDMVDATLERNIMLDVVRMHLGEDIAPANPPCGVATIRAFYVEREGTIREIVRSPRAADPRVRRYQINKRVGDRVRPVQDNFDRLGFVVVLEKTVEASRRLAQELAEETRFLLA